MDLHFLNGDSLLHRFPLEGEIRVMREAIIDGPLQEEINSDFEDLRARYHAGYDPRGEAFYRTNVAAEWHALGATTASRVFFWFDADAFCQLNQLFLMAWLHLHTAAFGGKSFFYIRPQPEEFVHMQGGDFAACLNDAMPISAELVAQAGNVWRSAARQDFTALEYQIGKLPGNHFAMRKALRWYADYYRPDPITREPSLVVELRRWLVPGQTPPTPAEAFRLFQNRYRMAGLGDTQFFSLWNRAQNAAQ